MVDRQLVTATGWVLAMAVAAATASVVVGLWLDSAWAAGVAAAMSTGLVALWVWAKALRAVVERFLAAVESPELDSVEVLLAARVGLDLATVKEAKVAVRAAVRATMARRGAGLAALCAVPVRASALEEAADGSVGPVSAAAGSSVSEKAAEPATCSAPGAESPSGVVLGLPAGSAPGAGVVVGAWKDRRDDVE